LGAAFHRLVVFISSSLSSSHRCLFVDHVLLIFFVSSLIAVSSLIVVSSLLSCCHCLCLRCHLCHCHRCCHLIVIVVLSSWCCCHRLVSIAPSSSLPTSIAAPTSVAAITAAHQLHHHVRLIVIFLHSPPLLPSSTFSIGDHHRMIRAFGVNPRRPHLPLASRRVPHCHCRCRHPLPSTTISSTSFFNLHFSAG
jgi:hypothetical protein